MHLQKIQKNSSDIVVKLDKKFNLNRDAQLCISQLVEELGELACVANLEKLRNKKPRRTALEDEFADVFILLASLANNFNVDLEKAILKKIKILKQRHNL